MARVFGVFSAALVSVLVVGFTPSMAVAQEDSEVGCAGGELVATDEAAALALAAECDQPVEIALARGFAERQYAEPDGTVTLESYLRPQWAYDDAGNWVAADPTLVAGADGVISTVATVVDVERGINHQPQGPQDLPWNPGGAALACIAGATGLDIVIEHVRADAEERARRTGGYRGPHTPPKLGRAGVLGCISGVAVYSGAWW